MKISLLLPILLFVFSANSQEVDPANRQKAKEILDKVSAKVKAFETVTAAFTFKLENLQEEISDKHKGLLKLKGDKYYLELMGAKTYCDAKTKWTHLLELDEVNVTDPKNEEESLNPAEIFTMYETGFKYTLIREKFENNRALYIIDLYPEDLNKQYSRIRFKIDKTKNEIYSVEYKGKDGNNYIITIHELIPNKPMPDNTFVFDEKACPACDVVDMR